MQKENTQILKRDLSIKENELKRTFKKIEDMNKEYDLLFRHEDSKYLLEKYETERDQEMIKFNKKYDSLINRAENLKEKIQELRDELAELE